MPADPAADEGGRFADLRPRLATALVMAPVALGALWWGGVPTMLLVAALGAVLMAEWRTVTLRAGGPIAGADWIYVAAVAFAVLRGHVDSAAQGFVVLGVLGLWAVVADAVSGRGRAALWGALGLGVIGSGTLAFLWIRDTDPYGVAASLWIVMVVVATDVGGYFAGRLVGGRKLWPAVSPKKTWSGLGGAIALAALAGLVFSWQTTGTFYDEVCLVSAVAAVCAQLGDIGESAVKRRFGVKDSGRLFPGHGGALDRFDGLIAATLIVAAVTLWRGETVFIWQ